MVTMFLAALTVANPPLLSKYTDSGFVEISQQMSEQCDVYADRVVMTLARFNGSAAATVTTPIQLDGSVLALIAEAAEGPMTREVGPTDGPATVRFANLAHGDAIEYVDLGRDVSALRTYNHSQAAHLLTRLLDHLCPAGPMTATR